MDSRRYASRVRSVDCHGVNNLCPSCRNVRHILHRRKMRRKMSENKKLCVKAPLLRVAKGRVTKALKEIRRSNRKLEEQLRKCQEKLKTESLNVQDKMSEALSQIMTAENIQDPLLKLFWTEQKKNLCRTATARRWHPMMIRLAILIHSQSPQAYNTLRNLGVLVLPGESTLRDFTNAINPSQGFNPEVIEELRRIASGLTEDEKWMTLMHDEMSIKHDLVIASTADKASPNQRLVTMHGANHITNIFALDREIYFISDPPHLLKTVRNNLSNSGSGLKTRYLWNNDKHLLWSHVRRVYEEDAVTELRKTKLTRDHIYLTSYSVMKVNLAAQVLSASVGKIMEEYHNETEEMTETARLIKLMDRFFDCLNVRSQYEGSRTRKPDLLPYTDQNDPRYEFLMDVFLGYLTKWHEAVEAREGFSKSEKVKMFLSQQTYKGIVTTVKSVIALTQFLLRNGVKAVYTNRLCQDPLESHFGRHRALARRSDNPNMYTFGYQENKLRIQRSLALSMRVKGNTQGAKRRRTIEISNSPLKRRKNKAAICDPR